MRIEPSGDARQWALAIRQAYNALEEQDFKPDEIITLIVALIQSLSKGDS